MVVDFIVAHISITYKFIWLIATLLVVVFVAAAAIARIDRISFEDALYFSLITALTVGFGEITPKSRASRVLAVLLSLIGVLFTGLAVAAAVHSMQVALGTANPV